MDILYTCLSKGTLLEADKFDVFETETAVELAADFMARDGGKEKELPAWMVFHQTYYVHDPFDARESGGKTVSWDGVQQTPNTHW